MAEHLFLDAGNSEVQDKQSLAYMWQSSGTVGIAASGVIEGLAVAQTSTASGSVLIGAGAAINQGSLGQGVDELNNPAVKTLDVFTSNPVGGLPRNDIIAFDSITKVILAVVGTPNAVPTDPTVAATMTPLARLRHAASAPSIPTAKIDQLAVLTSLRGADVWTSLGATNSPFVGSAPPVGTRKIRYSGTTYYVTNAFGSFATIFPTPFPNGIVSCHFSPGDTASNLRSTVASQSDSSTSIAKGYAYGPSGALIASLPIRVCYTAEGW